MVKKAIYGVVAKRQFLKKNQLVWQLCLESVLFSASLIKDPKLISAMQELGRGLKSPSDPAKLSRELLKITVEASLKAKLVVG